MSADEYVPSEDQVRGRYCDGTYVQTGNTTEGDDFDAWLARVRRDAASEAWTDCVSEASALGWLHPSAALDMLDRNPHEETP